ncbi:V-type ATP synthase subunit I [Bacteroidales bacterium Barb6]|nr:V-type ATP synthase subunit I [Bacteroidales bacterium Barb6]
MILPMKKYAFMVYHKEYEAFLFTLRELGVVHVKETQTVGDNAALQSLAEEEKRITPLIHRLKKLNEGDGKESEVALAPAYMLTKPEGQRLVEALEGLEEEKTRLHTLRLALEKDIEYMTHWGDFSREAVGRLKEAGYTLGFYTCAASRFNPEWEEKYHATVIRNAQSVCYFVTLTPAGVTVEADADAAKLPDYSLSELIARRDKAAADIQSLDEKMKGFAASEYNALKEFGKNLQDEYNLAKVMTQTERQAGDKLMLLEGWILAESAGQLEKHLAGSGFYCHELEIQEGDKVPVKLKNNSYVRLFEPITRMFSLPGYTEFDPTPLLAPFFMLFFGLCFGDGGYGLFVLVACIFLKKKMPADTKPILSMLQWLGGTAILIGALTGTFFGVALTDISMFEPVKEFFLTSDNLMTISVIIGLVHIVFGKGVAASKTQAQKGIKYSIAPWAWVFAITALLLLFGLPVLDVHLPQVVEYACYGIAGLSALAIFFYNSPGKSIFANFGAGLWNTYNAASGLLGDTLSYIRLFAIGLTGGILGGVFNLLATSMTETLPLVARIPAMLVILLIGHGLNFGLCMISSMVHPVRLIFVEYFKNSEYEGGGKEFQPFKRVVRS